MSPGQFVRSGAHRVRDEGQDASHVNTGIPSVMQMIRPIRNRGLENRGRGDRSGNVDDRRIGRVSCTASATVLNTGRCFELLAPLPGVTPATTLVPYSIICFAWNDPSRPVMPAHQASRLIDKDAHGSPGLATACFHRLVHVASAANPRARESQCLPARSYQSVGSRSGP